MITLEMHRRPFEAGLAIEVSPVSHIIGGNWGDASSSEGCTGGAGLGGLATKGYPGWGGVKVKNTGGGATFI